MPIDNSLSNSTTQALSLGYDALNKDGYDNIPKPLQGRLEEDFRERVRLRGHKDVYACYGLSDKIKEFLTSTAPKPGTSF